jgi:hypothetical protein
MIDCGLMSLKQSITTLPLTLWIGSTTTATARGFSCSKLCKAAPQRHRGTKHVTKQGTKQGTKQVVARV